jgi:outer membrane protein TolC
VPNPPPFTLYNASVSVSYVFDVFGANRRALESTLAQVDYQAYEMEAARLSVAANVVSTAIRRASLQRQIDLTTQLAQTQARQLAIMQARYAAGGVAQIDLRSQRTLLAQTRASLPPLETQREATEHQLAISGLNIWNVGLGLTQPLFHGGELRAKKRASEAAYEAAFADYRQTVLQALQQVADSLQALQNDATELQARDDAAREAQANAAIAQTRYNAGGVSEFSLIDAQRQALQTTLDRSRAHADRLTDTAALYQALGGAPLPGTAPPGEGNDTSAPATTVR